MPNIELNMVAIGVAAVAAFVLGFVWYAPLFGKTWAKEMGFDPDEQPDGSVMAKGMSLNLIGHILMVYVFANNMAVWDPTTWGHAASTVAPAANAGMAAFFTWLGFFLPVDLNSVAWEKKSWKLFGINTGYHFLSLLVVALVLSYM